MEEHSSERKQFQLSHGHEMLGTLSSRSDLAATCDLGPVFGDKSFINVS